MELTKNIISRDEALKISPDYVAFIERSSAEFEVRMELKTKIYDIFNKMKRGQKAITFNDGKFIKVKVTSVNNNDWRAIDGPIVRVGNGEYTWRVDGAQYAFPIKKA